MTGTATSRGASAAIAAISLALALAGCGGGTAATGFAWLSHPAAPAAWPRARIADGAAIRYPPGWSRIVSDRGTATVALRDSRRRFVGYLNLTPRQGAEAPAGWAAFRVAHNAAEGDRDVRALSSARGLRFRTGRGSCVKDRYRTPTGASYTELACLVVGARASVVVVGAAPPGAWSRIAPLLEQAISSTTT